MKHPVWLLELHRQWQAARGRRITGSSRAFSRNWERLLEDAGILTAEDQATAAREAERFEKDGRLVLKRHRYRRYLIEGLSVPLDQEAWLGGLLGIQNAAQRQQQSLEVIGEHASRIHPRFPGPWSELCRGLGDRFRSGRSWRPFRWSRPESLRHLLEVLWNLSTRDWETGTPIRAASVEVGLDSKGLERHARTFESGLTRLHGAPVSLKSLGLVAGDSFVELSGPLCLHFPDGTSHDFDGLAHPILSAADLARCTRLSTRAARLLTIENRKTTFRQFAAANEDGGTLIATTSFPTPAFREFLVKLPRDLPHHHFGDTDPAGWQILEKLREASPKPVSAFHMTWRAAQEKVPLTPYDQRMLPKLLESKLLTDVRGEIDAMAAGKDRGNFEQETLGAPDLKGWPFFRSAPAALQGGFATQEVPGQPTLEKSGLFAPAGDVACRDSSTSS